MVSTMDDFRNFYSPQKREININLKNLIKDSITLIHNAIANHNITINIDLDEGLLINTYKNEIKQVFLNLIKNFIDVVEEKKISAPSIHITAVEYEQEIKIMFEDNGGGIEPEYLDKVFSPYFTTKDSEKGTGLGLYMSKLVIEEHCNGTISA